MKRLDLFILKAFLQLLAATFFICLFIFMMQYTWRYIDELIGKGLSAQILAQFFWYMALTMVPAALPLGVLLASLITFGNMGENLELLSMKAAGIPLLRILQPLIILTVMVCGISFYFQNRVAPEATKQLGALLYSMKQKSPELEIPEGVFYSEIPGYNIFVERKDIESGMLYGVMIYNNGSTQNETQIVLADSARLQSTADKMHLMLTLYSGERFRNMDARSANMMKASVPYMRETFLHEVDLIEFDANFNVMDASLFAGNASTKDLHNIRLSIDSLTQQIDSLGTSLYAQERRTVMVRDLNEGREDSVAVVAKVEKPLSLDSILHSMNHEELQSTYRNLASKVRQLQAEYEFRAIITDESNRVLRLHHIEAHRKFTLSLSCLIFFFIGAPLGAIIRKGGLGVSVIVSVGIFIFYYIVNAAGEKMAKTGQWYVPFGLWLSSMVLVPVGCFLTYKSNQDSAVFNIEGYRMFFMRLLGLRESRKINRKEVIINAPDYADIKKRLATLQTDCQTYAEEHHLMRMPNYRKVFFQYEEDTVVIEINERLEALVAELHNSRDGVILNALNEIPIMVPDAHTRPFRNSRYNMAAGILLPAGLFFYLRIWRYRVRLLRDMTTIRKQAATIIDRIDNNILPNEI